MSISTSFLCCEKCNYDKIPKSDFVFTSIVLVNKVFFAKEKEGKTFYHIKKGNSVKQLYTQILRVM